MSSLPGMPPATPIRAPRGLQLCSRGWKQEAALRLLMNSLDPDVAAVPMPPGGAYHAVVTALTALSGGETLLVQPGVPPAVFPTHDAAPRVLVVDATTPHECAAAAGGWMELGTQAHLQASYESLAAAARQHFDGSLAGKLVLACALGGARGAQPLAATLNGAAFLGIEADTECIKRLLRGGGCDIMVHDLDEALRILKIAVRKQEVVSVALLGNGAVVVPEMARRGVLPDLLTGPAHDDAAGPAAGMRALQRAGAVAVNPGRPQLGQGRDPVGWVALSGGASDIHAIDAQALRLFSRNEPLGRWLELAKNNVGFQGLPARVCWLNADEDARLAAEVKTMAQSGQLKGPVAYTRTHAVTDLRIEAGRTPADWLPALLAAVPATGGASWMSVRSCQRVGAVLHTGQVIEAQGQK